jgi:hypothetical protein
VQHSSTLKSPRNSLSPPSLLHTKKIFVRTNFLQLHELLSEECNLHKPALVHHQIRCNRRKKFGAFPSLGVFQTTKKCVCCTHALCELTTPYRESETDAWKPRPLSNLSPWTWLWPFGMLHGLCHVRFLFKS